MGRDAIWKMVWPYGKLGDLRCTHSHLKQGTRPSCKITGRPDMKQYLHLVDHSRWSADSQGGTSPPAHQGAYCHSPIYPAWTLDCPPHSLCPPKPVPIKAADCQVLSTLNTDAAIKSVSSSCHLCQSLASIPSHLMPQSSSAPLDRLRFHLLRQCDAPLPPLSAGLTRKSLFLHCLHIH